MKRKLWVVGTAALTIAAMGMSASAMPISIEGGALTVSAVSAADQSASELSASQFQLLGTDAEGMYIIFADQQFLKVSQEAIQEVLGALGAEAVEKLPKIDQFESLSRGSRGDAVVALQQNLQKLEFMSGSADGDFGGQSERAVIAFQQAMGLEESGVADPMTQMLIASMVGDPVTVATQASTEEAFAVISGKTDANLNRAMELGMKVSYDDIAGVGLIDHGAVVDYAVPANADIDRRAFSLNFALGAAQGEDGTVKVEPVVQLSCTGVQRPMMQELILKSGDERCTFAIDSLQSALSGVQAVEKSTVILSAEAVEMLANASEKGELKIRIGCKYDSYDITVSPESLARISQVGEAALALHQ